MMWIVVYNSHHYTHNYLAEVPAVTTIHKEIELYMGGRRMKRMNEAMGLICLWTISNWMWAFFIWAASNVHHWLQPRGRIKTWKRSQKMEEGHHLPSCEIAANERRCILFKKLQKAIQVCMMPKSRKMTWARSESCRFFHWNKVAVKCVMNLQPSQLVTIKKSKALACSLAIALH